jgi:spermidine synthase
MKHLINHSQAKLMYNSQNEMGDIYIYENSHYRWLKFSDHSIQGIMNKSAPEKMDSPIFQALLLFLLSHTTNLRVLNLGLGSANLVRSINNLASTERITLCTLDSVEINPTIVTLATDYFKLPKNTQIILSCAQKFIAQNQHIYDVLLIDIFNHAHHPDFIQTHTFWQHIVKATSQHGIVSINLSPKSSQQLQTLLIIIRTYFAHTVLIEFNQYENIVAIFSQSNLHHINKQFINKHVLFNELATGFTATIKNIHYIQPAQKAEDQQ